MLVDGVWNITVNSPIGAQQSAVTLKSNGTTLTGSALGEGGVTELADGKVDGQSVSWSSVVSQPFPMTVEFSGTVSGDEISGRVKAGDFGVFPFSGKRS